MLYRMLQLTNIAGPVVCLEFFQRFGINVAGGFVHQFVVAHDKMLCQQRDVFFALPQGWDVNIYHTQTVEQIAAQLIARKGPLAR